MGSTPGSAFAAQEPGLSRVLVYVQGKPAEPLPKDDSKSLETDLKSRKKEAQRAVKDLEKRFGKDVAKWPKHAKEHLLSVVKEIAEVDQAFAEFDYRNCTQKDIDNSARDLRDAITGQMQRRRSGAGQVGLEEELQSVKLLLLVDEPEQADLVLEIQSRRSCRPPETSFWDHAKASFLSTAPPGRPPCVDALLLKLSPVAPVARVPDEQSQGSLHAVNLSRYTNGRDNDVRVSQNYESNVPYWEFEFVNTFDTNLYDGWAIEVAKFLGKFAEENNVAVTNRGRN